MSLPMLVAIMICPAMLGAQESIRGSQSQAKREEHRGRKCNLVVSCAQPSSLSSEIDNKRIVLWESKLYIMTSALIAKANGVPAAAATSPTSSSESAMPLLHPFTGYFLPYPPPIPSSPLPPDNGSTSQAPSSTASPHEGLVTTTCPSPPQLNWVYLDRSTHELKHGLRTASEPHITGPFDCTRQDRRLTLEGWEGFVAVREEGEEGEGEGIWALYFDRDDDGLREKMGAGKKIVLEVEVWRREMKGRKPVVGASEGGNGEGQGQGKAMRAEPTPGQEQEQEQGRSPEPIVKQGRIAVNGELSYYTEEGTKSQFENREGVVTGMSGVAVNSPSHDEAVDMGENQGDGRPTPIASSS
ncbi:hypothetical protein F4778DRAFT_329644 [Xylariomycetidae sp. FL2044]|nr:hypothetical protein F4778DRAFT_329644 [Xylariomycetidae sp. FL2044]